MRKLLYTFILVLLTVMTTNASHLMGGQITSRNIGGLTYEVTLTLYRDTVGIPMYLTETINYQDSLGVSIIASHTLPINNMVNIGNGVERYQFIDTITFPNAGNYRAYYTNCCRNAAILNIPNASSYGLYLDVDIFADSTNSSPVFLNEPITIAQVNQPFSYNPLPFDADGDSLSWILDIPYDFIAGTVIGQVIPGYVLPFSDSLIPFSMDPLTGEITFLPNTLGHFQVSVRAIEWRNGQQIGYIRRDMQLIVVPSVNSPVLISTVYSTMRTTTQPIYVQPNQQLSFELISYNIDMGQTTIATSGSIFMNDNPAVVSLSTMDSSGNIMTTNTLVEWTPTAVQVSNNPYYLVFRVGDPNGPFVFYNDYTFRVFVSNSSTGINEITGNKSEGKLIRTIDVLGREINPDSKGLIIRQYDNGTSKKFHIQN